MEIVDCGAAALAAAARAGSAGEDVTVVTAAELGAAVLDALASARRAGKRTILLLEAWPRTGLREVFEGDLCVNLLAGGRAADSRALPATFARCSGAEARLGEIRERGAFEARASADRALLLDEAGAFAARSGAHPRLCEAFRSCTDELLTNALYHAGGGALSRDTPVTLPRAVEVTFLRDPELLAVTVRDPFGALPVRRVREALATAYGKGPDQIAQTVGGAGLGLYTVAEAAAELIVFVRPGVSTEVTALVPACDSFRDAADRGKGINVFGG